MLAVLPTTTADLYSRDFRDADKTIASGRVVASSKDRQAFWRRWVNYAKPLNIDPLLINTPFEKKIRVITGFAARVRRGDYGQKDRVSCGRVQDAIRAVGQTCELDYGINPLQKAPKEYLKPMELQFAGYRKEDPPPVPELAVPVQLVNQIYDQLSGPGTSPKQHAVADLCIIAFYYLLRVGEYTCRNRKGNTRTVQFRFQDIAFKADNYILPLQSSTSTLMTATGGTLRLSNQKNGIRGSLIHRSYIGEGNTRYCPVRALVRRFDHLRSNKAHADDLLSTYWDHNGQHHIRPDDIMDAIRVAAQQLKLENQGIPASRIGTHSLRAGGAMALKFSGADRDDIKKLGRWTSDTFLIYIHDQIAAYQEGWTQQMSQHRHFFNLEGAFSSLRIIEQTE